MSVGTSAANAVYPAAGIFTAQIAGIPTGTIGLGIILYIFGCLARGGFELQRTAEGGDGMKPNKIAGWIAGGIGASVFATPLYLAALKYIIHVPVDGPLMLGLMPIAFYGTSLFTWAMNFAVNTVNKRFNLNIPLFMPKMDAGK